jgi:hypothetical protein
MGFELANVTGELIEKAIRDSDYGWSWLPKVLLGIDIEVVEKVGGDEVDGEHVSLVIKFTQGEESRYFEKHGTYQSFEEGTSWSSPPPFEVFPHQVTVTQYKTTKAG